MSGFVTVVTVVTVVPFILITPIYTSTAVR
jgi:hypothetical protein